LLKIDENLINAVVKVDENFDYNWIISLMEFDEND
jgi:hypothetical protein